MGLKALGIVELGALEIQVHSFMKVVTQVDREVKKTFECIEYRGWDVMLQL